MGVPLRIIDPADKPDWAHREAGMMWRYPPGDEDGRECWWICLPTTHPDIGTPGHPSQLHFATTERASEPPHEMWEVTGTPPNLTVKPSIDVERWVRGPDDADGKATFVRDGSYWHGWITNGQMDPA